jgi:FlaA1/EpsC-like NDP-sugar epimerase
LFKGSIAAWLITREQALYIRRRLAGRSPFREAQGMKNGRATRARVTANGTGRAKPVVITGGAGFIGNNLADRLLSDGEEVILFDNLSRDGVGRNYEWLERRHRGQVRLEAEDTRDIGAVRRVLEVTETLDAIYQRAGH